MNNTKKAKIMTIMGTRPEIIRLSCVLPMIDKYFNHVQVYTNQNYNYELSQIFFEEMRLRKPDYILDVRANSLAGQIANILTQTEKVMIKEKPEAILVLGDTNSALSAIIAKRMKIKIFHMEAGNRCFDWDVPEEINRRIIDHISDYNLAYTEHARKYLIKEGIESQSIFVTGSPMAEVFEFYESDIKKSEILNKLKLEQKKFFLASIHREENVDNPKHLIKVFLSLNEIAKKYNFPVIVSLHPRTKNNLNKIKVNLSRLVHFCRPFGYFDYNKLQVNSLCVLSDSGTIQEESAILRFNAVQVRKSTERPEAFDAGTIILTGFNKDTILNAVKLTVENEKELINVPANYLDKNVSTKVAKIIMGFTALNKIRHE